MTWEEIEREYPDKWVLIAEPELDDQLRVLRGRVAFAGGSQESAEEEALRLGLKMSALLWTGKLPEDMVVIL